MHDLLLGDRFEPKHLLRSLPVTRGDTATQLTGRSFPACASLQTPARHTVCPSFNFTL